jgi:hypothetical protein
MRFRLVCLTRLKRMRRILSGQALMPRGPAEAGEDGVGEVLPGRDLCLAGGAGFQVAGNRVQGVLGQGAEDEGEPHARGRAVGPGRARSPDETGSGNGRGPFQATAPVRTAKCRVLSRLREELGDLIQ